MRQNLVEINSTGCPLSAEAVSKLHNSFTPEVAFKHNVRRY